MDFAKVCQNDFDANFGCRSFVSVTLFPCKLYLPHGMCRGVPEWFRCTFRVPDPWCLWPFCFGNRTWHIDFTRCARRISIQEFGVSTFVLVTLFPCKLYQSHGFCKGLPEWFRCTFWCQILCVCDNLSLKIVPVTWNVQRCARMISMQISGPRSLMSVTLLLCRLYLTHGFHMVCQQDFHQNFDNFPMLPIVGLNPILPTFGLNPRLPTLWVESKAPNFWVETNSHFLGG